MEKNGNKNIAKNLFKDEWSSAFSSGQRERAARGAERLLCPVSPYRHSQGEVEI